MSTNLTERFFKYAAIGRRIFWLAVMCLVMFFGVLVMGDLTDDNPWWILVIIVFVGVMQHYIRYLYRSIRASRIAIQSETGFSRPKILTISVIIAIGMTLFLGLL